MDSDKLLNLATSLGCLLAESGAEIYRVEESVYRLLQAYQGKDAQVFAIPSCLIVSLMAEDGRPVTRMRRISAPRHGSGATGELQSLYAASSAVPYRRWNEAPGHGGPPPCLLPPPPPRHGAAGLRYRPRVFSVPCSAAGFGTA